MKKHMIAAIFACAAAAPALAATVYDSGVGISDIDGSFNSSAPNNGQMATLIDFGAGQTVTDITFLGTYWQSAPNVNDNFTLYT